MANLRVVEIKATDVRVIRARFTESLNPLISTENVTVTSLAPGVPNATVSSVTVQGDVLVIDVRPLTTLAQYLVTFQSTSSRIFNSLNGTSSLFEDGQTNVRQIVGPEEHINTIRDNLIVLLNNHSIYDLARGKFVRTITDQVGTNLLRARHDIRQAKSDNYLSTTIFDERKVRGRGASDRLNEEGAFDVVRVGRAQTNAALGTSFSFVSFPFDPITLQRSDITSEVLTASSAVSGGTFNSLVLTTVRQPVTKLKSVVINYQDGYTFTYNIRSLGYQIKEPRYDTQFASTSLTLENNQFKLSDVVLNDSSFRVPGVGDTVTISYEFKSLGRTVDEDSVIISQVLDATREPTPALVTEFFLKKAPVVTSADVIATFGGVQFLDPNSATPFLTIHPAFTTELPFRFESLPSAPGEYSVEYLTGRVFVFGEDSTNTGTGNFPPGATYKYRKSFVSGLDYTYEPSLLEVVSSPIRDLTTQAAKISFNFEENLIPGVDFEEQVHTEVIDERIENRLKNSSSLSVLNTPVTNAFRIFNETSSELYNITRFNKDTIFFNSTVPPRLNSEERERVVFSDELNELLIIEAEIINSLSIRVLQLNLLRNNIINNTEDAIGSSYNSSIVLSRGDIFGTELFYDGQDLTVTANINRLTVGQYQVDYRNGIIYVGVTSGQNQDLGTINYKKPSIKTKNNHIISVSELFHSLNPNLGIAKRVNYVNFTDTEIFPSTFDVSDERFLNQDTSLPYTIVNNTITVTDDIKVVRNIFDLADVNTNIVPTNFSIGSTFSGAVIILSTAGVEKQDSLIVGPGLTVTVPTITAGIELNTAGSVVRISDGYEFINGLETISGNTITLSASSTAIVGDVVNVVYTVVLNGAATPVVDYDRGEYFANYTFLADEILVSYEHGDNSINFRSSDTLNEGDNYFVTYKIGALRDSLLTNFGTLVDIPEVQNFDIDFARDSYRDVLIGALQSFTKGPTIPAMETLVSSVSKITPQIIEAIFEFWSLGVSHLFRQEPVINGNPQFVAGKFDLGLLTSNSGESVTLPVTSNLRLEEGWLEMFVKPEWNGLDNDGTLTFSALKKDGVSLTGTQIFIGATSFNPTLNNGSFTINRLDDPSPVGLPSAIFTSVGIFIYFDSDVNSWKVLAKDRPRDGYDGYMYSGNIQSSGEVYNVKFIENLGEIDDVVRSDLDNIEFEFNLNVRDRTNPDGYAISDGYIPGFSFDGISFLADNEHYLVDFAEDASKNRFSLFKDGRGYLNFKIFDRGGRFNQKKERRNSYKVSADISNWVAGESHHIGIAWKLNTAERQDEMHLFIDGFEIPNIIRYGGRPASSSTDRFRTVVPEVVAGVVPLTTIAGNDLNTVQGLDIVSSDLVDFGASGILPGHTIDIQETGFGTFTILSVSANSLTLSGPMPATLADARFSINPFSTVVASEIDIYKNIAVSILNSGVETEIPGVRADVPGYSISKNSLNENVLTILGNADAGDSVLIRTLGLNHRRCRENAYIWGNTSAVLKTNLPPPINLDEVLIKKIIMELVPISSANAAIVGSDFVATGLSAFQPSNGTEGRRLDVRVTGGNADFSTPTAVTINGTTSTGPLLETLSFSAAGIMTTTLKFLTITNVDVTTTPLTTTLTGLAVEIKEAFSVTVPDGNVDFPVVRFSYKTQNGITLTGDGSDVVVDANGFFPLSDVGNLLVINSPLAVAGTFTIAERLSNTSVRLDSATGSSFSDGNYDVFNVIIGRSGFQNGFFFLQKAGTASDPFPLTEGFYEFDYSAYLEIPFDPLDQVVYIGSDFTGNKQSKAVIDELRILSTMLTDTRIGETIIVNEESATTSFQAIREFKKNTDTLMLLHFNKDPLVNDSDYVIFANREFIQSSNGVNANFGQSILVKDKGLIFDNTGRLTTTGEGSVEFWISPLFDTNNDPVNRVYFDATSSVIEEVTSITKGTVAVSGRIGEVLSVRLASDAQNTGVDFFPGGSIASDFQTINLGQALPFQKTPVKIAYTPSGLQGDRLTIFKDTEGFITLNVRASGTDFQVRQPVFWKRDTWHKVRVTFKFNRQDNLDEIRLWVDSEERGSIRFGSGILFGDGTIFGQTTVGVTSQILITDINFVDPVTQFFVGMDFMRAQGAYARIDNLRLSNVSREPITVSGQPLDVTFSSNLDVVFPVIEDAFTTFLLDFERVIEKTTDFAILRDSEFGIFNFTINIIDSFGIVSESARIRDTLEAMILALKPGTSKVDINIIR